MNSQKPSWKDAPKWANFLAMDQDGTWFWYENEPLRMDNEWLSFSGEYLAYIPKNGWEVSIEERK